MYKKLNQGFTSRNISIIMHSYGFAKLKSHFRGTSRLYIIIDWQVAPSLRLKEKYNNTIHFESYWHGKQRYWSSLLWLVLDF